MDNKDNKLYISINGESVYIDVGEEYGKLVQQSLQLEEKIRKYRHRIAKAREEFKDLMHSVWERERFLEGLKEDIKDAKYHKVILQTDIEALEEKSKRLMEDIEDLESKKIELIETIEDLEAVVEYKKEEANGTLKTRPIEELFKRCDVD